MSELTEEDIKYFGSGGNEPLSLDLSDIEPHLLLNSCEEDPITAYGGKYSLAYIGAPHHSQTDYNFTGPDFVLRLSGEERSLGSGRAILTSPARLIGEVNFIEGGPFTSIPEMNQCFRIIMACYTRFCRAENQLEQYKSPDFRNQITIGMMQGVKRVLHPQAHAQIPEGLWWAEA